MLAVFKANKIKRSITTFVKQTSKRKQKNCSSHNILKILEAQKKLRQKQKKIAARKKIAKNIAFWDQGIKCLLQQFLPISLRFYLRGAKTSLE